MSSLEERVSWTRDAVLERSRPRVAQRETYSRRSGSRPPFVDVALSAMRSDLHDPFSKPAMKSNMAGEADLRNTVCLLQSRCATRGVSVTFGESARLLRIQVDGCRSLAPNLGREVNKHGMLLAFLQKT